MARCHSCFAVAADAQFVDLFRWSGVERASGSLLRASSRHPPMPPGRWSLEATMRVPTRQRAAPREQVDDGARAARAVAQYAVKAGWSGVVFAVLLVLGMVLVATTPRLGASDAVYKAFYSGGGPETLTVVGLYIVPFAGIACLWHMITMRTLLQLRRPTSWAETSHWLHLAASVIFVCMLFVSTAAVG